MNPYLLRYVSKNGEKTLSEKEPVSSECEIRVEEDGSLRRVLLTAREKISLLSYEETPEFLSGECGKDDLFFLNGYQSWTDSFERTLSEKEKSLNRVPKALVKAFSFDRYGDYGFYPYRDGYLHGFDLFYEKGKRGAFLFSQNAAYAYLLIEVERRSGKVKLFSDVAGAKLKAGETFVLAEYRYYSSFEEGLKGFQEVYPEKETQKIFGYTSWYNYYQDINERILLRDLDALDERFNLFQIDDGFESKVGDWLKPDAEKFPNGLSPIVQKIHDRGFKAGLWLAPFVAEEESELFRERKAWFKKDEKGNFVSCGSNWSGFYALDLENSEVLNYIAQCLEHYSEMGFDFFKLDFLYAASLPSYEGLTRAMAAERAYAFLREKLPGKMILGCGATITNAVGKFEYMRVGPDVSLSFDDALYMRFFHRERPSTKVTVQNTVYRSILNGRFFGNDPDVFLLRDDNLKLKSKTKDALLTLNALFGSVLMTSDNVKEYDADKRKRLDKAFRLFYNAKDARYERMGNKIKVRYRMDDTEHEFTYDTKKGEML